MARIRRIADRERANPRTAIRDEYYGGDSSILISDGDGNRDSLTVRARAYEGRWRY